MPRSKTSSDLQNSKSQDDSALDPPKPMARFRSVENIASGNKDSEDPAPVPAPRKGSLITEGVARPLPTPRRNVQSPVDNEESKAEPQGPPPPTAPRPKSAMIDRELPPVPRSAETSENYYAPPPTAPRPQSSFIDRDLPPVPKTPEISDNHYAAILTMDIRNAEAAKRKIGQMAKSDNSDATTSKAPPPVPKRNDPVMANSLLDEPVSPIGGIAPPDPFDTSGVSHLIPKKVPLEPEGSTGSEEKMNLYNFPVVPPRPVETVQTEDNYINPVSENFINHDDGLNDYGVIWSTEPGFSPPPAPPNRPCPSNPPPPPPREDSSLPLVNDSIQLPAGLGLAPPPPIPARPVIPADFDFTNENTVFEGPPVPSRPAPPPPIPKRPDC